MKIIVLLYSTHLKETPYLLTFKKIPNVSNVFQEKFLRKYTITSTLVPLQMTVFQVQIFNHFLFFQFLLAFLEKLPDDIFMVFL